MLPFDLHQPSAGAVMRIVGLVVGIAVVLCGELARAESRRETGIVLQWQDPEGVLRWSRPAVIAAVENAFSRAEIRIRWCDGLDAVPDGARVIALRFTLADSDPLSTPSGPARYVLGATTAARSESIIYLPDVARVLGYAPEALYGRIRRNRDERALSRALATIVVHEVVHQVLPTFPHTDGSLMQATLTRRLLLESAPSIPPPLAKALGEALAMGGLDNGKDRPPPDP